MGGLSVIEGAKISLGRGIRRDSLSRLRATGDGNISDKLEGRLLKETTGKGVISELGINLVQ